MKGYPKHVATKQDFLNLLAMPEHRAHALADLRAIRDLDDDTVIVPVRRKCLGLDDESVQKLKIRKQPNPLPLWQQKGFASREELAALIEERDGSRSHE